ncbi:MAG: class D sortase [Aquimonas sp.]|nr:class D sortase [Aquimonas sp.]
MRALEILLWCSGAALLLVHLAVVGWTELERDGGVRSFAMAQHAAQLQKPESAATPVLGEGAGAPSAASVPAEAPQPIAQKFAQRESPAAAIAVLRIPAIELEVAVAPGTDEQVLKRGAGWIEGTAAPGSEGNAGIAAHRDKHFRGLKDVAVGDLIELDTLHGTRAYRVTDLSVVEPTDVHVLADSGEAVLTLVTCFPFYFVGHAPQRFIVRALAIGPETPSRRTP